MFTQLQRRSPKRTIKCLTVAVLMAAGLGIGCPNGGNGLPGGPTVPADSDSSTEALAGKPNTLATIDEDGLHMARAVDENGNVHTLVVSSDASGSQYLSEYHLQTNAGTLVAYADSDGRPEVIEAEDTATGEQVRIVLVWSDSTHAEATLTKSSDTDPVTFSVTLAEAANTARMMPPVPAHAGNPLKTELRAQQSDENRLLLYAQISYQDVNGQPVSGLRPRFSLRALSGGAVFGVGRGGETGELGTYVTVMPAYRYRRVGGDYPEWRPYFERGVIVVATVTTILGAVAEAPVVIMASIAAGFGGSTIVPAVVGRLNDGVFSDVPYATALGQNIEYFEVRVSAGDRRDTTVLKPVTYSDLYYEYVEPGVYLDLGTVTVYPFEEQAASTRYRVYRVTQIGSSGQLEVLPDGTASGSIPLCRFEGGGLDCSIGAQLEQFSDAYPTAEAAVQSLCPYISNVRILPLGVGPAADYQRQTILLGAGLYQTLSACDG